MTFKVGETVVYPHHGAALIEAIETRIVKGEERPYLRLKVAQGDLTLMVPTDKVEYVGVRDVVDQNGLDRVDVIIPSNLGGTGVTNVVLTVDAQTATAVRINIQ